MGWTQPHGPSPALVARRELEVAARAVAAVPAGRLLGALVEELGVDLGGRWNEPLAVALADLVEGLLGLERLRAAVAAFDATDGAIPRPGAYC